MKNKIIILLLSCFTVVNSFGQTTKTSRTKEEAMHPIGAAWGFLYGYPPVPAVEFMSSLRQLGARSSKVYLMWHQLEPEKGKYDWTAIDALVAQVKPGDDVLVSVFSSSLWATKNPTAMIPASPSKSEEEYYSFIYRLVKRSNGKVRYWQNDGEPNNPIFWKGTAGDYISQLKIFYRAVKDADPHAKVVLGGYDGLFTPPGYYFEYPDQEKNLQFFNQVISEGAAYFDFFDIRLYGDPYTIPYRVNYFQKLLKEKAKDQPIICTEYHGPGFYDFNENIQYAGLVMQWQQMIANNDMDSLANLKNPLSELYAKLGSLPAQTEMFMMGCSPELTEKLSRLQSRDIVMRNMLAFSSGVKATMYWDLWNDTSDTLNITTLMYGKHRLMAMERQSLKSFYPHANMLTLLNKHLKGFTKIERIVLEHSPKLHLFKVSVENKGWIYVAWEQRDVFTGEDVPATLYTLPWNEVSASASDLFEKIIPAQVKQGRLSLAISQNPIFIFP